MIFKTRLFCQPENCLPPLTVGCQSLSKADELKINILYFQQKNSKQFLIF
jgi:hypothetical protein